MLLMIAYTLIALALVLVVIDAADVFLAQRRLAALADAAALAAAQEVNRAAFYASASCQIPISPAAADQAATAYLSSVATPAGAEVNVEESGTTVTVALSDRVQLPFQGVLGAVDGRWAGGVGLTVAASARDPLLGPGCSG